MVVKPGAIPVTKPGVRGIGDTTGGITTRPVNVETGACIGAGAGTGAGAVAERKLPAP
jgi:hypothetical protein